MKQHSLFVSIVPCELPQKAKRNTIIGLVIQQEEGLEPKRQHRCTEHQISGDWHTSRKNSGLLYKIRREWELALLRSRS